MKKSKEIKNYNCPRLKSLVKLTIEYLHHQNDHKVAVGYECDSDRNCDIGNPDGRGGYSWDRDLCPAVDEIKKMNC